MLIKCTKKCAQVMNQGARKQYHAELVELSARAYELCGGDIWDAVAHGDYNARTDRYWALLVTYPAAAYACPVYLTTEALWQNFRRSGVRDIAGLQSMLHDLLDI